jgi:hypothetical protein
MATELAICSQSASKIALDMFRLRRFDCYVRLLEKSEKVVGDSHTAVSDLR